MLAQNPQRNHKEYLMFIEGFQETAASGPGLRLAGSIRGREGRGQRGWYAIASISTFMAGIANLASTVVRAGFCSPKNSA
jgi:hypothetical protein